MISKQDCIALIDLTTLSEDDNDERVLSLCRQAITLHGPVAAVCIFPPFVKTAVATLRGTGIHVATVANFPTGDVKLIDVLERIAAAIQDGADEIDVVLPYRDFMAGDTEGVRHFMTRCREVCTDVTLKVILESGEFSDLRQLRRAADLCIEVGVDFLKTSTGKTHTGATLPAAEVILQAIHDSRKPVGFKASGGIRTWAHAEAYLTMAESMMGAHWISPRTFRFGASSLLNDLMEENHG